MKIKMILILHFFFNILNKDYIVVSNESKDIFSKIYEFKKDTPFVKDIFGTKENDIKFTIPWEYKDNFYIIEFCDELKISINNLFKNEIYAILFYKDERINSEYNNCFIYNKNYLFVNYNESVGIWDLINKIQYKKIYVNESLSSISPWNDKFMIGCLSNSIVAFDIEEEKIVKSMTFNKIKNLNNNDLYNNDLYDNEFCNNYLCCRQLKKIKTQFGECLVLNGKIKIFLIAK